MAEEPPKNARSDWPEERADPSHAPGAGPGDGERGGDALPARGFLRAAENTYRLRERYFPGLSDSEWRLFVTVAATPDRSNRRSLKSIAAGAGLPNSSANRSLMTLEKREVITREPHPTDGRVVLIKLTRIGKDLLRRLEENWADLIGWAITLPIAAAFLFDMGGSAIADPALRLTAGSDVFLNFLLR